MHLAQLNIATAKFPFDAPEIQPFMDNLEPVNQLAEASEGFIWRLKDESGDATGIQAIDDPNIIINMSVWQSIDALKNFIFRTHHKHFLGRKKEWFHAQAEDTYVLWWVAVDHCPGIDEAIERLLHLRDNGDSPHAFTFKSNFQANERSE